MGKNSNFREYVYVSSYKILRLASTLKPEVKNRVREVNVNLGPLGAGVTVDAPTQQTSISLVPEVEKAVDEQFRPRCHDDPRLAPGHWFRFDALSMRYGSNSVSNVVLFASVEDRPVGLLLGGSAIHLLDRDVSEMSSSGAAGSLLFTMRRAVNAVVQGEGGSSDWIECPPMGTTPSAEVAVERVDELAQFYRVRSHFLTEDAVPMGGLGRCLSVKDVGNGRRLVIGTPLYVHFSVPE